MKLGTSLINQCLQGASFGKQADEIRGQMRLLNNNIPAMRAFKENAIMTKTVMQTQEAIERMAQKLAESDWENLSIILNLMEQVTDGQVLVVEKEEYDQLEQKFEEEITNIPQM
jgi:phage shock protein A